MQDRSKTFFGGNKEVFSTKLATEKGYAMDAPAQTRGKRHIHLLEEIRAGEGRVVFPADAEEQAFLVFAEALCGGEAISAEERFFAYYKEIAHIADGRALLIVSPDLATHAGEAGDGMRGIRGLLRQEGLFSAQLRAALRASAFGRMAILLPFVGSPEEVRLGHMHKEAAMRELVLRGEPFDEMTEFGALVGTPAGTMLSRQIAEECDLMFADTDALLRLGTAGAGVLPNESGEGVLRMIETVVGNAHLAGRFAGVTGSMAAEPALAPHYLAMGADALAMPSEKLLRMRRCLRRHC